MKIEFKKKLPITIAIAIAISSILTIAFALLSINNSNIYVFDVFRILTIGGTSLTMLLTGVNCFVYQKQKLLGFFMWFVSAFAIFMMVDTIIKSVSI
jgi:hypothetical protein